MPLLVITRTPNKHLHIGDEIKIKLIKVEGNTVSLGVTAPRHVLIIRAEQDESSLDDTSKHSAITLVDVTSVPASMSID